MGLQYFVSNKTTRGMELSPVGLLALKYRGGVNRLSLGKGDKDVLKWRSLRRGPGAWGLLLPYLRAKQHGNIPFLFSFLMMSLSIKVEMWAIMPCMWIWRETNLTQHNCKTNHIVIIIIHEVWDVVGHQLWARTLRAIHALSLVDLQLLFSLGGSVDLDVDVPK
jgi:hypothetical protein